MKAASLAACLLSLVCPSDLHGKSPVASAAGAKVVRKAHRPHVLMISLDGMRPEYVLQAERYGLTLPTLRRFLIDGTYADGVRGVAPTLTFPSHTTLMTGVPPAEHGIVSNTVFDPMLEHRGEWYWYFRLIKADTLYQVASRAGLTTAAIGWPVTVGAPIDYLLAEFGQAKDVPLPATDTTRPADLRERLAVNLPAAADGDDRKSAWTTKIIETYNPNLVLVHLDDLDHEQHAHGPFSPEARRAIEKMDGQAGRMIDAELKKNPDATIVIVSDHGFARVDHRVALNSLFVREGLIRLTLTPAGSKVAVSGWDAQAWEAGGSAAIILRDPFDADLRLRVGTLLATAAADPAYGINGVLDHDALVAAGGVASASFLIDFKPGWSMGGGYRGPILTDAPSVGAHGYLPDHPDMRAALFMMGRSVARGQDLGLVDMRQIAPTVAQMLGLTLPAARLPALSWKRRRAAR